MKKTISVIIPCYNEQDRIEKTIRTSIAFLNDNGFEYEIMLVNDGSKDATLTVIKRLKLKYKNINYVSYKKNNGKGFAVRQGLLKSKHFTKVIIDADNSVALTELYKLNWDWIQSTELIKGQRIQEVRQPLYRIFVGKCFKALVWIFTGLYMDTQCPFTILRLSQNFYLELDIDGFAFDVEILYIAKQYNMPINKIFVSYKNNPDSKVTFWKTLLMLKEIKKIKKK